MSRIDPWSQFRFFSTPGPGRGFLPWLAWLALPLAAAAQTSPAVSKGVPAPELVGKWSIKTPEAMPACRA